VIAASSQSRQERAGGLNSVLRIASETNYGVLNVFGSQVCALRSRSGAGSRTGASRAIVLGHNGSLIHGIIKLTELEQHSTGN